MACEEPASPHETAQTAEAGPNAISCISSSWLLYGRTKACRSANWTVNVWDEDEVLVGQLYFRLTQSVISSIRSLDWRHDVEVVKTGGWGEIAGALVSGSAACGATDKCGTGGGMPTQPMSAEPAKGSFGVRGLIGTRTAGKGADHLTLTIDAPLWLYPAYPQDSTPTVRCDNIRRGEGCVMFDFRPTLTSMRQLPNISHNIRRIQQAGPHHYGRQYDGNPIRYTNIGRIRRANNRAACGNRGTPPRGKNCDEYPFQSTLEGASRTTYPDWGWDWVPERENSKQGSLLRNFYGANRMLNGDKFWVDVD
ncbi:NucA/NucB deoxyribonuclease domain-containing protein [Streptomyces sp. NPDC001178]